jgi:hypothetical protein
VSDVAAVEVWVEVLESPVDNVDSVRAREVWVEVLESVIDPSLSVGADEMWVEVLESPNPPLLADWYPSYVFDGIYWIPLFPPGDWPFED